MKNIVQKCLKNNKNITNFIIKNKCKNFEKFKLKIKRIKNMKAQKIKGKDNNVKYCYLFYYNAIFC